MRKPSLPCSAGSARKILGEGVMRVQHDDSIIQDVATEKAQDMAEVGVTINAWEYRAKWYGEDEKTAKARAGGLKGVDRSDAGGPEN